MHCLCVCKIIFINELKYLLVQHLTSEVIQQLHNKLLQLKYMLKLKKLLHYLQWKFIDIINYY